MEKIKFRAWDKIEKKMYFVIKIDWIEEKVVLSHDEPSIKECKGYERNFNCIELMQCMRQKDKNGQEVYDKDIIKYDIDKDAFLCTTNRSSVFLVLQDKTNFFAIREDENHRRVALYMGWYTDNNKYEIIGNEYEDPKLLERA